MARTGQELHAQFSIFIGDSWQSVATSDGTTTTIVDTALQRFGTDGVRGAYARNTEASHTAIWEVRRITDLTTFTATVAPAFGTKLDDTEAYEIHRWDPADKFTALDEAAKRIGHLIAQLVFDETLTGDGRARSFTIPTSLRTGPVVVQMEQPLSVESEWNFLKDPIGDSTTNFTATNTTATTLAQSDNDFIIPKYDDTATKLATATTTNGQYDQVVANMANDITAALAAGRRMTYGKWIYCRTPSRVTVLFVDDNGTVGSASSLHQGRGWELLHSTGNVSDANATTLTTRIDVTNAAGAVDLWWNRGWFYFGEADRITDLYDGSKAFRPRRDDTTQRIYLSFAPTRGYQLRLQGRNTLSLLGTTASTQVTNTMELDAISEQVLFAEAARILYGRQVFSSDEFPTLAPKIAKADELLTEMKKWAQQPMSTATIRGPYS
ncbi:hypothetical protein LCGC14_1490930 [marine sediment metagenome]|uniref:Uncharacterized protein n=1 Tax=marine sediment metagenome TaxID=412755 RepID=A0A0F9J6S3_9ZZZZ